MGRRRLERVTELIHQEISKRIPFLKDPGLGFITILGVRLSPDFMQARVFYSVLGSPDEQERTRLALDRARHFLRGQLGKLESLKMAPDIEFVQDHSAEEAAKVLDVLNKLEKDRANDPIAGSEPPASESPDSEDSPQSKPRRSKKNA